MGGGDREIQEARIDPFGMTGVAGLIVKET